MQALSQLSYGPADSRQCSPELVITCPRNANYLVVPSRREAQLDGGTPDRQLMRKEVTPIRIRAVRRNRVNLVSLVVAVDQTIPPTPGAPRPDHHDFADTSSPLALDAEQCRSEVQYQVITFVTQRAKHTDTVSHRFERDRHLRQGAFLIRRQH
jgi:hypothetical protein